METSMCAWIILDLVNRIKDSNMRNANKMRALNDLLQFVQNGTVDRNTLTIFPEIGIDCRIKHFVQIKGTLKESPRFWNNIYKL